MIKVNCNQTEIHIQTEGTPQELTIEAVLILTSIWHKTLKPQIPTENLPSEKELWITFVNEVLNSAINDTPKILERINDEDAELIMKGASKYES